MAHLKLFFPSVSSSNGLSNLLLPHLALSHVLPQPEDRLNDNTLPHQPSLHTNPARQQDQWRHLSGGIVWGFAQTREKIHSLKFIADLEESDYWGSGERDEHFVHVLELGLQQLRMVDIETVESLSVGSNCCEEGETISIGSSEVIDLA